MDVKCRSIVHYTIREVTSSMEETFAFNSTRPLSFLIRIVNHVPVIPQHHLAVAISKLNELSNFLAEAKDSLSEPEFQLALRTLLLLLTPMAPLAGVCVSPILLDRSILLIFPVLSSNS